MTDPEELERDVHYDVDPYADPYADDDGRYLGDHHDRPRRRRMSSCLPVLVALVVIAAGVFFGGRYAVDEIRSRFAGAPDFAGPGTGTVVFEVEEGASSTQIGRDLKSHGVVKSVQAFIDAAAKDEKSRDIQVGYYRLRKEMKATAALAVLIDHGNLMQSLVTVPEGARVRSVVAAVVAKTDLTKRQLTLALKRPESIGLPASAKGNPEGYLFPATYAVKPHETAQELLGAMVAKTVEVQRSLGLEAKAKALGYTPEQVTTVASILEYEANRSVDYPKVARVLYNRLEQGIPLQLDSTVAYVSGRAGDVWTTSAERDDNSLYNTYKHAGLPPGPIGSPGEETIEAALKPAKGDWLFFLPDFEHHTTLYYDQDGPKRQADLARIKAYCLTTDAC